MHQNGQIWAFGLICYLQMGSKTGLPSDHESSAGGAPPRPSPRAITLLHEPQSQPILHLCWLAGRAKCGPPQGTYFWHPLKAKLPKCNNQQLAAMCTCCIILLLLQFSHVGAWVHLQHVGWWQNLQHFRLAVSFQAGNT